MMTKFSFLGELTNVKQLISNWQKWQVVISEMEIGEQCHIIVSSLTARAQTLSLSAAALCLIASILPSTRCNWCRGDRQNTRNESPACNLNHEVACMLELSAPWEWIQPRQLREWTETVFSQSTEGQDKEGPLLTVGCSWSSRIDLCCFTRRKSHKNGEVKKIKSVWFPLHNQLQMNESLGQEVSYETFQNRCWDCTKCHWFLCMMF